MPVEMQIGTGKSEEEDKASIKRAIELSHEWLHSLSDKDSKPDTMIRCLAHSLGHILMGCPNEGTMKVAMLFFMQELDFESVVAAQKEGDDEVEDTIGEPVSASIN